MSQSVVHGRKVEKVRGWEMLGLAMIGVLSVFSLVVDDVPSSLTPVASSLVVGFYGARFWQRFFGSPVSRHLRAQAAVRELKALFSRVVEPPIEDVLAILEPIEDGLGVERHKALADRFFLGMIDRESFDRDMRRVLGVRHWTR